MPPRSSRTPPAVLRRLKEAGSAGTVFMVHPGALDADVHQALARALPEQAGLTVLDLSAVPEYAGAAFTGGRAETTIEALADRLLDELARAHDGTPYVLAGWSFGGVLAQAMVERQAAGKRPVRLVLLDSIAPTQEYKPDDDELDPPLCLGWFALYLGAKRGQKVRIPDSELAGRGTDDGLLIVRDAAVASGALRPDTPVFGLRKLYETYVDGLLRNNRLTTPYHPSPASMPLVLIRADRSLIPGDPTLGWDELTPHGFQTFLSPGDHYTMLSQPDAVAVIAQQVRLP